MAAQIIPFVFQRQHSVRVIVISGEPWFCLSDVCKVLSVDRSSDLIRNLDKKGWVKNLTLTQGGEQELIFVHQPNLYRVIFRSNKPEAKAFQDWVFDEVLPAISKTGRYEAPQPDPQPRLSTEQWNVIERLIREIGTCCHASGRARFAANERTRFGYGLTQSRDLPPEHFDTAKADLESLYALAEQHQNRMITLDEEFITAVIRPPVSIRKVRAMAKKAVSQPLSF